MDDLLVVVFPCCGRGMGCVVSMRPQRLPPVPELTGWAARAAFPKGALAIRMRDQLGELFDDQRFAAAFGVRGRPGISPGQLALVTVSRFVEDLTDRQAAEAVRGRIDWKYCLGMELEDPGFDFSVLSRVPRAASRARAGRAGAGGAAGPTRRVGLGQRGRQATHRLHPGDLGGT